MEGSTSSFSFVRRKYDDSELSDGEIDYQTVENDATEDANDVIGADTDHSEVDDSNTKPLPVVLVIRARCARAHHSSARAPRALHFIPMKSVPSIAGTHYA